MLAIKLSFIFLALSISFCPSFSAPAPVAEAELAAYHGPACTNVVVPVSITAKNAVRPHETLFRRLLPELYDS